MELLRTLAALAEPPQAAHRPLAELLELGRLPHAADYTELFELQLYPYASFYLGAEGMLGGDARDRIAGFWRALGETPPPEPDHLSTVLALTAELAALERGAAGGGERQALRLARRAWHWEHLASWLPVYLDRIAAAGAPYYRRWAELTARALAAEAEELGEQPELALHLRAAPGMADPRREGGEAFLTTLLAPVRSGLLLVRPDLERAAHRLGLGLRAGERRFALRSLLDQRPAAVLGWLAEEAGAAANRYRELAWGGRCRDFWAGRAQAAGELLGRLATTGAEVS